MILLLFSPSPKVNPPYYVPLVELVPHPETAPATMDRTYALMRKIGQSPVRVLKEVDGFVLNRLQYAVIGEAWRLVEVRAWVPPSFLVPPGLRPIFLLLPCVLSSILLSYPFSLSLSSSPPSSLASMVDSGRSHFPSLSELEDTRGSLLSSGDPGPSTWKQNTT